MVQKASVVSGRPQEKGEFNPLDLINTTGLRPSFSFKWGDPGEKKENIFASTSRRPKKKRRMISRPNGDMRLLHQMFGEHLHDAIETMGEKGTYGLRFLPSATGCVIGSNPLINAKKHENSEFFYITDLRNAYPSIDLKRLAILLVYIEHYDYYKADFGLHHLALNELAQFEVSCDPSFEKMYGFVQIAFGGFQGKGLAVGGPLSPYLLNLYCEAFVDSRLRYYFLQHEDRRFPEKNVIFTRFVDDFVFSSGTFIKSETRKDIREILTRAGLEINRKKSFVLKRSQGTVFITKLGMRLEHVAQARNESEETIGEIPDKKKISVGILTFPQKKRRRLHGILQSYLKPVFPKEGSVSKLPGYWNDSPEVVRGIMAEFIYYYKNVEHPTATDEKTMSLCKQFEKIAGPYLKREPHKRVRRGKAR